LELAAYEALLERQPGPPPNSRPWKRMPKPKISKF